MVVILAGVTMNFLLPLLLFFGIFFFHGTETPVNEPVLGRVMDHQPASDAGLMKGGPDLFPSTERNYRPGRMCLP